MSDFKILKNPVSGSWVISAPRRSERPDEEKHREVCPFCVVQEGGTEVYRVPTGDGVNDWSVRVINNKYPFAPHHEVIIHSQDHHRNFDMLPQMQVELILRTFRQRYNFHAQNGQVYIFHNHGHEAGESLHHPHSQLVVVPYNVELSIPQLSSAVALEGKDEIPWFTQKWWGIRQTSEIDAIANIGERLETEHFYIMCPSTSAWPDEVWIAPKETGETFGMITDKQISDLAFTLTRVIQIFDLRHGQEFSFNFYIYPGENWYLRIIPRIKILGGFEVGTGVSVNTQEPAKTMEFIREHFKEPNVEKIKTQHQADYRKKV